MIRRGLFFQQGVFLAILLGGWTAFAQDYDPYPTGPEAGRKLAAELCSVRPDQSTNWNGAFKILGRGYKIPPIPVACQSIISGTNWEVTYLTTASGTNVAEKLTIILSTNGPNQYRYARAASLDAQPGELKQLSGAEADIPLAGSDFWLSDLGLEFLRWPEQVRLKGGVHSSRSCYVLVSTNPHPGPGRYSRVKTWIDKESGQPLDAYAFRSDDTNSEMKSFSLGSVVEVNGHYDVKDMQINFGKSRTRLEIEVGGAKSKP